MKPSIYRQAAIDQMSSPDRLDEAPAITKPPDWLLLLGLLIVLAVAAVWGQRGRIPLKVDGQGVIVLSGGVVNVFGEAGGRIVDLRVRVGDRLAANQIIGAVSQPALQEKIQSLRETVAELERERTRASQSRGEGLRLQTAAIDNQRANFEREIAGAKDQIKVIDEQLRVEEELLGKGLITRQQVLATRQRRVTAETSIAGFQAQIRQLESNQFQNQSQVSFADRDYAARIAEAQRSVQIFEKQLASAAVVRTPYPGKVIELKVYPGALVNAGDPIVSIEPAAERFEAIAYLAAARAKEVRPGMPVEIVPASVRREEFGYLTGEVLSVAEFPATRAAVMRNFENDALVAALTSAGPVHEVRIALRQDPKTVSGFKWSTPQGPPVRISSGTLCAAAIVTRERRPLELAFPFLAGKLEF